MYNEGDVFIYTVMNTRGARSTGFAMPTIGRPEVYVVRITTLLSYVRSPIYHGSCRENSKSVAFFRKIYKDYTAQRAQ